MIGVVAVDAPAKVNLRLRVLAREESGFHSLESLFCAIDLADAVRVERAETGVSLQVAGAIDTGPTQSNLAARAARRFLAELGKDGSDGLRITLQKRIPAAAGLGGGSSDAAATLRALNRMYGEPLTGPDLLQLGIELGSDVPFFLGDSPLALGWSRGERLLALPPLPARPVLVAHPGAAMPTGNAFRRIAEMRGGSYEPRARQLRLAELSSWEGVAAIAANDFDRVASEAVPRVGQALDALRGAGATVALLAGSGACVFGIFPESSLLGGAEARLQALGCTTTVARTLTAFPEVGTPPAETA